MMIARCTAHLRPVSISALNTLSNMPIAPTCRVNDMFYVPQISNNYYTFIHRTHKSLDHNYQGIATGSKKSISDIRRNDDVEKEEQAKECRGINR